MSILTQKTISKKISVEGIGIHSGLNVKLKILPSSPNSGIVFKRVDLKKITLLFQILKMFATQHFALLYLMSMELKYQQLSI